MVSLRIEGLSIRLGEFHIDDVSLAIETGEYFVLLGPTGAGKSVLIECVAGLHQPDRGRVFLGDREITNIPLEQRGIGYVPQDYALFPNMTVRANIAFGLRIRHTPPAETTARVSDLVDLLGIGHLMERHPLTLSGGEKQRVALARALAVRPQVLLLDEPLAAVDERTRDRLCAELRQIQRATGVTVIHISHSFDETLAVADRIGIIRDGNLIQIGTPEEIFAAPCSRFVAEFTRAENVLAVAGPIEGGVGQGRVQVPISAGEKILLPAPSPDAPPIAYVVVRPEAVRVLPPEGSAGGAGDGSALSATLEGSTDRGPLVHLDLRTAGGLALGALVLRADFRSRAMRAGDRVRLVIAPEDVHALLAREDTA